MNLEDLITIKFKVPETEEFMGILMRHYVENYEKTNLYPSYKHDELYFQGIDKLQKELDSIKEKYKRSHKNAYNSHYK